MKNFSPWVAAFCLAIAAIASNAYAATINVLWYSYADPASEYKRFYTTLANTGTPHSTGMTWNITFWGPRDPPPNFNAYNVLVIHSGEAFRTAPPGGANVNPDYSGILANKLAIEAARGTRTLLSGSDADFHAVRGDSGVCGTGSFCFDGALGYVINAVNWAASGERLGILSFVDGNFPGSFWWENPNSFLNAELNGSVSNATENLVVIDPIQSALPMNQGLTSAGLSNWGLSIHGALLKGVPGYFPTMNSPSRATYAVGIAKETVNGVVEYRNTVDFPNSPGGHFFYSSDPAEQAAVDSGSAGAFLRTGRSFKIGGTLPVCRFYGSVTPGPNSHFFTVDINECNALKAAQVTPTPPSAQQWNYEGTGYATTPATVAGDGTRSCPANTLPVYRAYNNAYPLSGPKNPWDSNHRFTTQQVDIPVMVGLGWRDEGIVFCAPQ